VANGSPCFSARVAGANTISQLFEAPDLSHFRSVGLNCSSDDTFQPLEKHVPRAWC
jgi:hypothetical protein